MSQLINIEKLVERPKPIPKRRQLYSPPPSDKKFVCFGDYIIAKHDGEPHFINAQLLPLLYKIDSKDCVFARSWEEVARHRGKILLTPDDAGIYKLPTEKIK